MTTHSIAGGNGLMLHVEETGKADGKPILFIHGFSQSGLAWSKQVHSDLAREFRLVTMDIRGHGRSEKPPGVYGEPHLWAEDVHAVMAELDLVRPVLVGWSYGGVIVSDYLRAYGAEAIAGSVWVGAVSRLGDPLVQSGFLGSDFLALIPGFFSEEVTTSVTTLQRFVRLCVHQTPAWEDFYFLLGLASSVPPHVRQGLFSRQVDNDPVIRALATPMLLVYGEADKIVSPRMCTHLEALAQDATVSTYPDVGHMPFWEAADRFNGELSEFRHRV